MFRKLHQKLHFRITLKIKIEFNIKNFLEPLTPEKMKLHGSIRSNITKDKTEENATHLGITEVVLAYYNIFNNDYEHDLRVLHTFVLNK